MFKSTGLGHPWWYSGQESTCQCRGHRFDRWSRKMPHAQEQLSPCTATTEPMLQSPRATSTEAMCHTAPGAHACLESVLCNKKSHCNEKPTYHNQRKPMCSNEDPVQPKVSKIKAQGLEGHHKSKPGQVCGQMVMVIWGAVCYSS